MLNEVLATELTCVLRYRRYCFMTRPLQVGGVRPSFLRFAQVQQEQADRIAERILQLGGSPQVDPSDLAARSQSRCAILTLFPDPSRDCDRGALREEGSIPVGVALILRRTRCTA